MSISKPDAKARAAERLNKETATGETPPVAVPNTDSGTGDAPRKRGRPKGSKNSKSDSQERTREDIEQGKRLCAFLFSTLWGIAAPFIHKRDVTDEEALMIGGALDPVLVKYLPGMAGFVLEINLLVAVAAVWQATEIPRAQPGELGIVPPINPEPEITGIKPDINAGKLSRPLPVPTNPNPPPFTLE